MRILQIVPSLNTGGAEIFAFQLSLALKKLGHSVMFVSINKPEPDCIRHAQLLAAGITYVSLEKVSGAGPNLTVPLKLRKLARNWQPDVIHTHLRALAYSSLILWTRSAKFHSVHNLAKKEANASTRALYFLLFCLGWQPVGITPTVLSSIKRTYGIAAPLIENGVETPGCDRPNGVDLRTELALPGYTKIITNVGRLEVQKNQTLLLDAFARLANTDPALHLVMVGGDPHVGTPYLSRLKEQIFDLPQEVRRRIHLLGKRNDIGNILMSSDVFVLSSKYEGLPLALLEAMSLERKCVCTAVGGIPSLINKNTGWLVEEGNSEALCEAVKQALAADSQRAANAKNLYQKSYSMTKCAVKYESLFANSEKFHGAGR